MARIEKRYVDVSCKVIHETEKTIKIALVPHGETEEAEWFIPKSMCENIDDVIMTQPEKMQDVSMREWFAKKEGLV